MIQDALIRHLQSRVRQLETQVAELTDDYTAMSGVIADHTEDITLLTTRVDTLESYHTTTTTTSTTSSTTTSTTTVLTTTSTTTTTTSSTTTSTTTIA